VLFNCFEGKILMNVQSCFKAAVFCFAVTLMHSMPAHADNLPSCTASGQSLPVNNADVVNWKHTTHNQFHSRAHIQGLILQVFPDHSGHHHFEVKVGGGATDTVEVIYNEDFGSLPSVNVGDRLEACGDYITSNAQAGHYPPSPDGAIVHWVHMSPSPNHESGYIAINGVAYGQDAAGAGPKHGRQH
jgi:hypothetical protein